VSPEVGELDEAAVDELLEDDPDAVLAMLADLTAATDPVLRELARRLAGRIFVDVSRRGPTRPRGVGKLVEQRYRPDGGDLDLDASMDAIIEAGGRGRVVDPERLRVRGWVQPGTALCLLVDRSGSMGGKPLATSAVAAAAVAWRSPADYSVIAFVKVALGREGRWEVTARLYSGTSPAVRLSAVAGTLAEPLLPAAQALSGRARTTVVPETV
jgi:hypothetical protein